jgi:hypothetical protein
MRNTTRWRKRMTELLVLALLWLNLPGGPAQPFTALAAPSADPDEEIVYIDGDGVIRVLDTRVSGSNPEVKWFSPDGGWREIALGDVNNDGDMEIIAVGGGSRDGKLAIFDPVVASGAINPDQKINDIPWDTLFRMDVPGSPQLVAAGNFDENVPGDEIIFLYEVRPEDKENDSDRMRLIGLKADSPTPTGRSWEEHFTLKFDEDWNSIAVGNLDNRGTDEFVLVSDQASNMHVYRVDGGVRRIYSYGSSSRAPKAAAIGRWEGGTRPMLAWTRGTTPPLASLFVERWESDNSFKDVYSEAFDPAPRVVFFAQINNNDDEELVMLRTVPGDGSTPRMIVRGRRQGSIPSELEQRLDSDNGYRGGAAGDIDGDGMDEIVIIRDNRILVFYEPNVSARTNSYDLSTNRRSIVIGDLDKIGFVSGPQFGADRTKVDGVMPAGGQPTSSIVDLVNISGPEPIPFSLNVVGNPPWLTVTAGTNVTPANLNFTFRADSVPAGEYRTEVQITSSNPAVVNQPFIIEVTLRVTAALVSLQPAALAFSHPCTETATIQTQTVAVGGTAGIRYTAALVASPNVAVAQAALTGPIEGGYIDEEGKLVVSDSQGNEATVAGVGNLVSASGVNSEWPSGVPWATARSQQDVIPDTITIEAGTLYSDTVSYAEAYLVIVADARAGAPPSNVRLLPISNLCATSYLHLSLIAR